LTRVTVPAPRRLKSRPVARETRQGIGRQRIRDPKVGACPQCPVLPAPRTPLVPVLSRLQRQAPVAISDDRAESVEGGRPLRNPDRAFALARSAVGETAQGIVGFQKAPAQGGFASEKGLGGEMQPLAVGSVHTHGERAEIERIRGRERVARAQKGVGFDVSPYTQKAVVVM